MASAYLRRLGSTRGRVLLVLCGLLAAGTVAYLMIPAAPGSPSREMLLARSSRAAAPEPGRADGPLQPVQPAVQQEEFERSRLPLTLLGTFAASEPSLSRAMFRHRESQETLVVGVGDEIEGHALVVQIERERVVLRENGVIRELVLDGERAPSDASRVAAADGSGVPVPAATEDRPFEALVADLEGAILDATVGQARVLPEVEGDRLVGLHVSAIQEGSRFAEMGIEEDDVITRFNGVAIDSPFLALHAVREMLEGDGYHVMVRRGDATAQLHGRWDGAGNE